MNNQQATQILEFREKDNPKFQKRKDVFLGNLNAQCLDFGNSTKTETEWNGKKYIKDVKYNPKLKHFEMYNLGDEEPLKTKEDHCQFINKNSNTRTKTTTETCLEIDKLEVDKAISIISEVCLSLIRNNFNFFVWYAEGQKSPHVRIYDFKDLDELDPQQRIKAQVDFWREQVPFGMFHYVDTGMFQDDKTMQLEYSIHWKYGTHFDLLFEYKPEVEQCNQ